MKASFPANAGSRLEKTMRLSAKLVAVSSVLALFAGGGTWALAAMTELHPIGKGNLSNGNTTTGKTPFTGNTGASSTSTLTTTSTSTSPCGLCDTTTATLDGMGQLIRTQHPSVWGRMIEVDGSYDQLGRLSGESNPYFPPGFGGSDATTGSTYHSYDGLNREVKTTLADGSTTSVSYQGNCTVHTDGAGATTKSCVDGLGRLTSVAEPGPAAGTAFSMLMLPYISTAPTHQVIRPLASSSTARSLPVAAALRRPVPMRQAYGASAVPSMIRPAASSARPIPKPGPSLIPMTPTAI
jgi:YD repeat-containing protein